MIRKTHQKAFTLYTGLALLVGLLFITSMFIGPSTLSINAVWAALVAPDQSPSAIIVNQIRLPRTILAALVGATLGLAGSEMTEDMHCKQGAPCKVRPQHRLSKQQRYWQKGI